MKDDWGKILSGVTTGITAGVAIYQAVSNTKRKPSNSSALNTSANKATKNKKNVAIMLDSKNTDIASLAASFLNKAIDWKTPTTIDSGDKVLEDSYSKYSKLIATAISEIDGYCYENVPHITTAFQTTPSSVRATKNVINTVSVMFEKMHDRKIVTIVKLTSGLVSTIGGDPKIAQVMTFFVNERYPRDIANIYNLIEEKKWELLVPNLVILMQKLRQDREIIRLSLTQIVGKKKTDHFIKNWQQHQVPLVDWTILASNLINVLKGMWILQMLVKFQKMLNGYVIF